MYAKLHPDDETCEWSEHVKTMPTQFDTTVYWSDEELAEVKSCMVFHLTGMMKRQIQNDYMSIHEPLSQNYPEVLEGMSIHLYTWALTVVYSRALDITRGKKHVRVIVPILDMANHNPHAAEEPSDTLFYDDEKDVVQLLSATDLKTGEECFIVYGKYPNAKLLFNYGFALLDNPHRAIDLWTKVSPTTFQAEMKQTLLRQNELTAYQSYDFSGTIRPGFISPALLATVRVIQADAAIAAQIKRRRLLAALIVRVGERELLGEALQLVAQWTTDLDSRRQEAELAEAEAALR
jgi:hypothetical protein